TNSPLFFNGAAPIRGDLVTTEQMIREDHGHGRADRNARFRPAAKRKHRFAAARCHDRTDSDGWIDYLARRRSDSSLTRQSSVDAWRAHRAGRRAEPDWNAA